MHIINFSLYHFIHSGYFSTQPPELNNLRCIIVTSSSHNSINTYVALRFDEFYLKRVDVTRDLLVVCLLWLIYYAIGY
jgi:hypothetical protein